MAKVLIDNRDVLLIILSAVASLAVVTGETASLDRAGFLNIVMVPLAGHVGALTALHSEDDWVVLVHRVLGLFLSSTQDAVNEPV